MRARLGTSITAVVLGLGLFTASSASAALLASDNASDPAYVGGWNSGTNGGTGWGGGWTFRNGGNVVQNSPSGSFFGRFIGSSLANNNPGGSDSNGDGDINTSGNKAWALYANTSNEIYAVRPFNGALSVGQSVWFEFDNGNVDSTRVLGVRLLANAADITTRQFETRFVGGDSFYTTFDSTGSHNTALGFSREGISVEFTLTSTTTYSIELTRLQSGQKQTLTGSLIQPGGNTQINAIAFRNLAAGTGSTNDGFFNSIAVVPEPAAVAIVALVPLLVARGRR